MMNDVLGMVERLAARARLEEPKVSSVANEVIWRLRRPERSPLLWLSAGALLTAALLLIFIGLPQMNQDALDLVFEAAQFIGENGDY